MEHSRHSDATQDPVHLADQNMLDAFLHTFLPLILRTTNMLLSKPTQEQEQLQYSLPFQNTRALPKPDGLSLTFYGPGQILACGTTLSAMEMAGGLKKLCMADHCTLSAMDPTNEMLTRKCVHVPSPFNVKPQVRNLCAHGLEDPLQQATTEEKYLAPSATL